MDYPWQWLLAFVPWDAYAATALVMFGVTKALQCLGFSKKARRRVLVAMFVVVGLLHLLPGPPSLSRNYFESEISLDYQPTTERENGTSISIEIVSWTPRAFYLHNVATDHECETLIEAGKNFMEPAQTYDFRDVSNDTSFDYRTSTGTFLKRYDNKVVARVAERISILVGIPPMNSELIQLLRYETGQYYKPHTDFLGFTEGPEAEDERVVKNLGNDRACTVLLYLTDVAEGGETSFPEASPARGYFERHRQEIRPESECSGSGGEEGASAGGNADGGRRRGARVQPRKGSALVFWSMDPQYALYDPFSVHEGCPVLGEREKWTATFWIHQDYPSYRGAMEELQEAQYRGIIDSVTR